MEWSDTVTQNVFGFVSALIGAVVGGYFTLYATNKAMREQYHHEEMVEEKEIQNLLDALYVEIDTLWSFHLQRVGGLIERLKEGDALEFYYPLTQDYFTIYHTNADHIGAIKDTELRRAIVVCYNKCKKVVDGFKYNNELYSDYNELVMEHGSGSAMDGLIRQKRGGLEAYARLVREDHYELKGYVETLLTLLRKQRRA
jgi:hypothetical protein